MMRFKSPSANGFQAFAVSGVNTISFAITATEQAKQGLLGFAVERALKGQRPEFRPGFKVFRSLVPHPTKETRVSTKDHPVQSFVWDDFTALTQSEGKNRSQWHFTRPAACPTNLPAVSRVRENLLRADYDAAPCLFGLYSAVAILYRALPESKRSGPVRWPGKSGATFSDALAAVRRWLWSEWVLPRAGAGPLLEKLPGPLQEVLLGALTPA
jgi:hypothetical protein